MIPHNRRGELGWNLETIGKLLIGLATLILVIYISMKLVEIFIASPSAAYGADVNLELIEQRIAFAKETDKAQSLIVSIPGNAFIVGFDAQEMKVVEEDDALGVAVLCDGGFARPKQCPNDQACLCAYGAVVVDKPPKACANPVVSSCVPLGDSTEISGTYEPVSFDKRTFSADIGKFDLDLADNPDSRHPGYTDSVIFAVSLGPRSTRISIDGNTVLLEYRDRSEGIGQGGSFGGSGASSTY